MTPPVPIQQVQPDWPPELSKLYIEEPDRIELVVDADGIPFSVASSSIALDENVLSALSKWRFKPGKKDGKKAAFSVLIHFPVRRAIDPDIERTFARFGPSAGFIGLNKELADAVVAGSRLDESGAEALEKTVAANPENINARATLLAYYAHSPGSDAARTARLNHIEWLVRNVPASPLCGVPLVQINALASPLQDATGYAHIRDLWFEQISRLPEDGAVLLNASRFLRIADPEKGLELRALALKKNAEAPYALGEIYGLAALGVTGVDLASGTPLSIPSRIPETVFAKKAQAVLMETNDTPLMLAGLATVTLAGRSLSKAGHLPGGYKEFCESLLGRARQIDPAITTSCDPTPKPGLPSGPPQRIRVGGNVQAANLIKKVQAVYPFQAKSRGVQGSVRFTVVIDKEGKISHITFVSGPLPLYEAARDAAKQWTYKPTLLNGEPVEVVTAIDINFNLGR